MKIQSIIVIILTGFLLQRCSASAIHGKFCKLILSWENQYLNKPLEIVEGNQASEKLMRLKHKQAFLSASTVLLDNNNIYFLNILPMFSIGIIMDLKR